MIPTLQLGGAGRPIKAASSGPLILTPAMLDPLNKGAAVALSNLNLTATKASGTGWQMARSTVGVTTGKYYFEVTWVEFSGSFIGVGIGDQDASVSNFYGSDANGIILINNGQVYASGAVATTIQTSAETNIGSVAFDADARLVWFRTNGGNWNNSGTANPATGVGGISFPGSMTGTYYPGVGVQISPNDRMTINFGETFTYTPPAGFGIVGELGPASITAPSGVTETV